MTSRGRAVLFALCLVAGGAEAVTQSPAEAQVPCGIVTPCPPPPPPPPTDEEHEGDTYQFSIDVNPPQVVFGEQVLLHGKYTRNYIPEGMTQNVHLMARTWPATSFTEVARTGGFYSTFSFAHQPRLNTEYYVISDDLDPDPDETFKLSTPVYKVLVYAELLKFKTKIVGPYTVKMRFAVDFPEEFAFPLEGHEIRWYIVRRDKATRIAKTKTRLRRGNEVTGRIRTRLPRGRYKFKPAFCFAIAPGIDTGLGEPELPCP